MKNAPDRKAAESAQEQRQFSTDNPRHQRVLALLLQRPARLSPTGTLEPVDDRHNGATA